MFAILKFEVVFHLNNHGSFTQEMIIMRRKRKKEGKGKKKSLGYNNIIYLNAVFHLLSLTLAEKSSSEVSSHAAFIFTLKQSYSSHQNNNNIHEERYWEKINYCNLWDRQWKPCYISFHPLKGIQTLNTIQLKRLPVNHRYFWLNRMAWSPCGMDFALFYNKCRSVASSVGLQNRLPNSYRGRQERAI